MIEFSYKGRSDDGSVRTGRLIAASADAAAGQIMNQGLVPVEIRPVADKKSAGGSSINIKLGSRKPTSKDMILFCRQMYTITRTGLPLLRGLTGLMQSTHNETLREALVEVIAGLESGRSLSAAFRTRPDIFPEMFVSLVEIGESTGTVDTAFERLYAYLQMEQEVRDRVKSAVRYPIVVMCTIAIALGIITVFVIPNFEPIFRNLDKVPLPTQIIIGVSNFAVAYWLQCCIALVAIGYGISRWTNTNEGRIRWDRFMLQLPVVGTIVRNAALSRLTQSLAVSLRAGLPLIQTLQTIGGSIGNAWLGGKITGLCDGVERGESLTNVSASSGLFTPLVIQMMGLGEETGALPELMEEASSYYRREVDYDLENLSAALEPILIISVGAVVLVLALGVFLPMWDMVAQAKAG